nr:EOG090X028J [Triops cancriformis]
MMNPKYELMGNGEYRLVPRSIPAQNVVLRLRCREMYGSKKAGSPLWASRSFYQNIFPNFTVVNIDRPPCFLRKFSPDGKHFIAFSSDQTSIEVYEYQGPAAAADLLQSLTGEYSLSDAHTAELRSKIFGRFFRLKFVINVSPTGEQLNRECSLFTDDGRYVIIGSASYLPEDPHPAFFDVYRNNESVSPHPFSRLEDYSLHVVDVVNGRLCETKVFKTDKIFLSHNQGLYLYKNTLAVLSVQHQTIHVFKISEGMFLNAKNVGRFCFDDDEFITASVPDGRTQRPFREVTINSLKHRLLAYLFRRAWRIAQEEGSNYELRRFYMHFEHFRSLRMWKMQLLDEVHLLIKYASEDVVTLRSQEPNTQPSFFVVYNMESTEVLNVYENSSTEFLELFENFCDYFRNAGLHSENQFTCSPSSNVYARVLHERFKQTIVSARFGGPLEATKRLLAQLPISAQSYSSSPYLDLALFSYDEKWISVMERPKASGEHPIRFYARDSGLLKFCIHAGVLGRNAPPTARRLVAFTFHPTDPFAISVQRTNAEYVVNLHVRHVSS